MATSASMMSIMSASCDRFAVILKVQRGRAHNDHEFESDDGAA
jgi:hypothetical protein